MNETIELASDPAAMIAFKEGIREINEGKGIDWEKAKAELD